MNNQSLSPNQVKEQHPEIYKVFFDKKPKPEPTKELSDNYPKRSDYDNGRQYAQAIANHIKERTVKLV